jgi:hypothetical protein
MPDLSALIERLEGAGGQLELLDLVTGVDGPLAVQECFPGLDPDVLTEMEAEGLVVSGERTWFHTTAKGWRPTQSGLAALRALQERGTEHG